MEIHLFSQVQQAKHIVSINTAVLVITFRGRKISGHIVFLSDRLWPDRSYVCALLHTADFACHLCYSLTMYVSRFFVPRIIASTVFQHPGFLSWINKLCCCNTVYALKITETHFWLKYKFLYYRAKTTNDFGPSIRIFFIGDPERNKESKRQTLVLECYQNCHNITSADESWGLGRTTGRTVGVLHGVLRARIFKHLWSPGIDSKEWVQPAYVAWRAGTITLFLLGA